MITKPFEKNKRCVACGKTEVDRAHIKSKGSGGTWKENNVLALCRNCHIMQHQYGWNKFVKKYPKIKFELESRGWELKEVFGVIKLMRKDSHETLRTSETQHVQDPALSKESVEEVNVLVVDK